MRYVLHFRPTQDLQDLIMLQTGLELPGSGAHTTICAFNMKSEQEHAYLIDLHKLKFPPFEVQTTCFESFDEGSLVLRTTLPPELLHLHKEATRMSRRHASDVHQFDAWSKNYYFNKYNPHITLGKNSGSFNKAGEDAKTLLGQAIPVSELHLQKKDGQWSHVAQLYAQKQGF